MKGPRSVKCPECHRGIGRSCEGAIPGTFHEARWLVFGTDLRQALKDAVFVAMLSELRYCQRLQWSLSPNDGLAKRVANLIDAAEKLVKPK